MFLAASLMPMLTYIIETNGILQWCDGLDEGKVKVTSIPFPLVMDDNLVEGDELLRVPGLDVQHVRGVGLPAAAPQHAMVSG